MGTGAPPVTTNLEDGGWRMEDGGWRTPVRSTLMSDRIRLAQFHFIKVQPQLTDIITGLHKGVSSQDSGKGDVRNAIVNT